MKVRFRRKQTDGEQLVKTPKIDKPPKRESSAQCKAVSGEKGKKGKKSDWSSIGKQSGSTSKTGDKIHPKKPKWSLSRPPPVQTSYGNEPDEMPRISIVLSMNELQEEALARGIERSYMPSNKVDLLNFLVDGSIHLRRTKAWKEIERLKSNMEAECRRIECERTKTISASQSSSESDLFDIDAIDGAVHDRDIDVPVTFTTTRDESNLSSLQSTFHSQNFFNRNRRRRDHSVERTLSIRPHKSYQSAEDELEEFGHYFGLLPRTFLCGVPVCSSSNRGNQGDSDSVSKASDDQQMEDEFEDEVDMEQRNPRHEDVLARSQHNEVRSLRREHRESQPKKPSIHWDASIQFEQWIVSPPQNNQRPSGSLMKGFTVWCSISSEASHHPPKQFDSTYKNLSDANNRARYLFYWRNPWHASPMEMVDLVVVKSDNSENNDCASTFYCVHPNGDKWIVSVVHDSTFKYLDNATMARHDLDQDWIEL